LRDQGSFRQNAPKRGLGLASDAHVLRKWANDDLRSLNAEIEFLLRRSLHNAGRLPASRADGRADEDRARS